MVELVAEDGLVRVLEPALRVEGLAANVADSASLLTRRGPRGLSLLDVLLPGMMGVGGALQTLLGEDPRGCFWLLTPATAHRGSRALLETFVDHRLPRPWDEPSARRVAAEVSCVATQFLGADLVAMARRPNLYPICNWDRGTLLPGV